MRLQSRDSSQQRGRRGKDICPRKSYDEI